MLGVRRAGGLAIVVDAVGSGFDANAAAYSHDKVDGAIQCIVDVRNQALRVYLSAKRLTRCCFSLHILNVAVSAVLTASQAEYSCVYGADALATAIV